MTDRTDPSSTDGTISAAQRDSLDALDRDFTAAGLSVATEIRDGELVLSGFVDSDEDRQAATDLAQPYAAELGLRVDDGLDIEVVGPETAFGDDDRAAAGFGDLNAIGSDPGGDAVRIDADGDVGERAGSDEGAGYDDSETGREDVISLDADFAADPGTTNVIDVIENGATYFPPTDPPTARADDNDGFAVLSGFADTADETMSTDASVPEDDERRLPTDDELSDIVRRELRENAVTTDLGIHVSARGSTVTLRGEVDTLEDAENAEAVANDVPAVVEVREELTIRGITEREGR